MLKDMPLQQTNRPLDVLTHWMQNGGINLNPPYQRGDVWGMRRRRNLIRSLLLGIPIPSLIINNRLLADWPDDYSVAVIDGKQRITTVLMFLNNELDVPGDWFGMTGDIRFNDLSASQKRKFENRPIPFSEGRLKTIEEEIEVFELVNFGGVPQGESDKAFRMRRVDEFGNWR